jgi:hypothetical protein
MEGEALVRMSLFLFFMRTSSAGVACRVQKLCDFQFNCYLCGINLQIMNMNKTYLLALALTFVPAISFAQSADAQQQEYPQGPQQEQRMPERKSSFEQADYLRGKLGLSDKQFSKVYDAYTKYNKAVFGGEPFSSSNSGSQGGRPQGGPGGGRMGGGPGGQGGPGGGMMGGGPGGQGGPGGGMMGGGPGGQGGPQGGDFKDAPQGERPDMPKQLSEKDIEKRMKNMEKQEQKLAKTMKKTLGNDALYNQWLEYHESQKPHKPEDFNRPNQQ